jgi:hypothetical protein
MFSLDQEERVQLGKSPNIMSYGISIRTDGADWEILNEKFDTFDEAWEQAHRFAVERIDSSRVLTVVIQRSGAPLGVKRRHSSGS